MNYEDISRVLKAVDSGKSVITIRNDATNTYIEFEKSLDVGGNPSMRVNVCGWNLREQWEMSPNKFSELIKDAFDDYLRGYRYDNPNDKITKIERN